MPASAIGQGVIVETQFTVNLHCPLTCVRITLPARGRNCAHVQCFDLSSFLRYCRHQCAWHCPICLSALPWQELAVDRWFSQLLAAIDADATHATIYEDGTYKARIPDTEAAKRRQSNREHTMDATGWIP